MANPLLDAFLSLGGPAVQAIAKRPGILSTLGGPLAQAATPGQYPPIDLGTIGISKPASAMQPPGQPIRPPVTTLPEAPQQAPAPQGDNRMGEFLRLLGIPLATAAVGLAGGGNGITAGAAGFNKGYGDAAQKRSEIEQENKPYDYVLIDKNGNEVKRIRVPKGTHVAQQSNGGSATDDLIVDVLRKKTGSLSFDHDKDGAMVINPSRSTDEIKKEVAGQYSIGQEIDVAGKKYKVTGFAEDGEPLVDIVR